MAPFVKSKQFINQIGQLLTKPLFEGYGGRGGYSSARSILNNLFGLHRPKYDYESEAGPLWQSSIPATCLSWERRASIEAECVIQKRDKNGDWANAPRHRALDVLSNPNPFFDIYQLMDAVKFDYRLAGNAYIHKVRARSGKVVQLWWIPSWLIEPRWSEDGTAFIECYEYTINGKSYALNPRDVIHFRNGVDPRSQGRRGLSDFAAVLREVCTDNEAATIAAALCRNMGIPGVIISPKQIAEKLTKAQRDDFKEQWRESFRGENAGEPFIQSIPVEITTPGFDLQQMAWDKLRKVPEERISAAFGIPAVILGLGAGLAQSNTKAGQADAREQAYESCIIPTLIYLARTLTRDLLSEFADVKQYRVWFDLSGVRCLQADEVALYNRLEKAAGGPFITPNEARKAAGFVPIAGADKLREGKSSTDKSDGSTDNEENSLDKGDNTQGDTTAEQNEEIEEEVN